MHNSIIIMKKTMYCPTEVVDRTVPMDCKDMHWVSRVRQLNMRISPQTNLLPCVLLFPSSTPAEQTLMPSPRSGESCSSLSPGMFGVSGIGSFKLAIPPWPHVTGEAFPTESMLRTKTRMATSGSSKVGHTEDNLKRRQFECGKYD